MIPQFLSMMFVGILPMMKANIRVILPRKEHEDGEKMEEVARMDACSRFMSVGSVFSCGSGADQKSDAQHHYGGTDTDGRL